MYYNDLEFNQEIDINKEEAKALGFELRNFILKKIEISKIQQIENIKNPKEVFESLFEKFFPFSKSTERTEEKIGFQKYIYHNVITFFSI